VVVLMVLMVVVGLGSVKVPRLLDLDLDFDIDLGVHDARASSGMVLGRCFARTRWHLEMVMLLQIAALVG
jgi:hypothetical protein